jgi:hypothetical protein
LPALPRFRPGPEDLQALVRALRGFAARVARRAFQGDTGQGDTGDFATGLSAPRTGEEGGRLLQFVLACTAAAAGLLLVLAIGVRQLGLPQTDRLEADDQPAVQLDRALEELDRLNRAEKAPHAQPKKP